MLDILHFTTFFDPHLAAATSDMAASTQSAAEISAGMADTFWSNIFKKGLFGRIVEGAMYIAGIGVIYRGYIIIKEASKNVLDIEKVIGTLIAFLLVFVMLAKSGEQSMYAVHGMRNFGLKISNTVLAGISDDFQSLGTVSKLDNKLKSQPAFQQFKKELDTCATSTDPACFTGAIANLRRRLTEQGITDPDLINKVNEIQKDANAASLKAQGGDPNANKSFLEKAADTISLITDPGNAILHLIELILTGLAIAFFFAIDLAMLLFGLTFPINVALFLFDPAPLKSWFGNFWTLINAKFCFAIITGIIVYLQLWMETNGGNIGIFVIEILLAIFAPFATFFYCQGSALALAGAMNSMALSPIKGALSAGAKAGGSFLGGALKGAGISPKQLGSRFGGSVATALRRK